MDIKKSMLILLLAGLPIVVAVFLLIGPCVISIFAIILGIK